MASDSWFSVAMDFAYTPALEELKERAATLAGRLMGYEDECERKGGLPSEQHAQIRRAVLDAGLQAINMPADWGGAGLSVLEQVVVQEQLGRLTNALWDTVWRPANPLRACTREQRARWLEPGIRGERRDAVAITEERAGSDPSGIETVAVRAGDGWRITGVKWFVTVGDAADHLLVLARAQPGGEPTMFIVDKDLPGVHIRRVPAYTHTFVFEHPEFGFDDVEVGAEALLGEVGGGYELTRDWFTEERIMIGARTIGAATRATELAAEWAKGRVQGGARLIDHQMIAAMLADSATEIATNRVLTHQVAQEFDRGGDRKTLHAKAAMVKLSASEASNRILDRCVQILGGRGYMREQPVERLWRELRVDRIWEGTSEIQRLVIANEIDKRGLDGLLAFPASAPAVV
ncbi:MAG TPA: acyl-CoA dehydrogenase family protein [Solirubrobacteraceae bacterium]|jgi:butyryl-CoA dehydrogenase|nr:acyl-CoA dehydrogenase family protein [Solirubrobacteraceae bacterium]